MSSFVKRKFRLGLDSIFGIIREAHRRSPLLFGIGAGHFLLLLVMLCISPFDDRIVMGINPWIKPIKFAFSIALYALAVGWFLKDLPASDRAKRWVTWVVALSMIAEMVLIGLQATRGTTSHFNLSSLLNAAIFGVMGVAILFNTIAIGYATWKFWRSGPGIPSPYLWGIRLGFLIFMVASLEGFVMSGHLSHSIGTADGGPGLPLVNWSTIGGDLRVAHFLGLHSLQILPFLGFLLSSPGLIRRIRKPEYWLWAAALIYGGLVVFLFLQALAGQPVLRTVEW